MSFEIIKQDKNSRARVGKLTTNHGVIQTPAFVVVGTEAKVRALEKGDLTKTNTQVIIANTYHLWQKLGDGGLKKYQGLHSAMSWDKPLMTDSGGFQVFSMGYARELGGGKVAKDQKVDQPDKNLVRITKKGAYFQEKGKEQFIDPQKSIWIQEKLGADIILAFDEPSSPYHDYDYTKQAMERTHRWAKESIEAKTSNQLLFGIVQGGIFEDLRTKSSKYISKLDFDGFAIGGAFGSSFGSKKEDTFKELDWVVPNLPESKPRHLLGIGLIEDIFRGVEAGIDSFDCVVPTREARHGSIYTRQGRINLKKSQYREDGEVLDPECDCWACQEQKTTRSELRKLFKSKDPLAGRLATIHNLYFFNQLLENIREAIKQDNLEQLKEDYIKNED